MIHGHLRHSTMHHICHYVPLWLTRQISIEASLRWLSLSACIGHHILSINLKIYYTQIPDSIFPLPRQHHNPSLTAHLGLPFIGPDLHLPHSKAIPYTHTYTSRMHYAPQTYCVRDVESRNYATSQSYVRMHRPLSHALNQPFFLISTKRCP